MKRSFLVALACCVSFQVFGESPSFTYLSAGYQYAKNVSSDQDDELFDLEIDSHTLAGSGSFAVSDWAHLYGSLIRVSSDDTVSVPVQDGIADLALEAVATRVDIGVGANLQLGDAAAFYGRLGFSAISTSAEASSGGIKVEESDDENAPHVEVGVRAFATSTIELSASVLYLDAYDGSTDITLGADYWFSDMFSVGVTYENVEGDNSFGVKVGMRW